MERKVTFEILYRLLSVYFPTIRPRICKNFELTRTSYSNCERSVQFLKHNALLTYSWRFFRPKILEQLEFKLEKIIGIYKPTGKVRFGDSD